MDKTMKAAVARAFGKPLEIEEVAVPRPRAGELLVKIEACGVCHTDLHAVEGAVSYTHLTLPTKRIV